MKKLVIALAAAGALAAGGVAVAATGSSGSGTGMPPTTTTAPAPSKHDPAERKGARRQLMKAAGVAAATVIGISPQELRADVQGGQTVAQVAEAKGVDPAKVVEAVVSAAGRQVDQAVSAGQLDAAQATRIKARLPQLADRFVNQTGELGRGRGTGPTPGTPASGAPGSGAPGAGAGPADTATAQ